MTQTRQHDSSLANQRRGECSRSCLAVLALLIMLATGHARAAETVHLFLKADGVDIKGESTQISLGREDSIECITFTQNTTMVLSSTTGLPTSTRSHGPIVIRKRIDKSSPLLYKAMVQGSAIDAAFMFYRPNPIGDGTTQQFYTIQIAKGRIIGVKQFVEDMINPTLSNRPPMEEVTFTFSRISWVFNDGGIGFEDTWSTVRAAVSSQSWEGLDGATTAPGGAEAGVTPVPAPTAQDAKPAKSAKPTAARNKKHHASQATPARQTSHGTTSSSKQEAGMAQSAS